MQLPRTKEWREAAGLTQRQLSKESGVGKGTIVRIENGESATPRTAKKIADTLNISVADLLESPPVPLGHAPTSSKPAEEAEESKERREELLEEERGGSEEVEERIVRTETLEERIEFMKRLAEKRQREIEEVRSEGVAEVDWLFGIEAIDERLDRLFKAEGISDYVRGVNENRIMDSSEARQRCEEFARVLWNLKSLTREAMVVQQDIEAKTRVKGVKMVSGVEEFLYSSDPQREGSEGESQGDAGS